MKIWIDFINTPQVSFWVPFIKDFKIENQEVILTCRDSGNTVALLEQQGLAFHIIGQKVGKGLFQKAMFFPKRLILLFLFIRKYKPEKAVNQSSFYQPIIAWLLGIPCLYTNDNEHAKGNFFGFLFAKRVILPIALKNENFIKKGPLKNKVSFYPSVKEAIYLSQQQEFLTDKIKPKNCIFFRPEPWSAQYYKGPLNFFDDTLLSLSSDYEIIILPRDKNQSEYYKQGKFNNLRVAEKPIQLKEIVADCLLFIGAGGSMTRELAVLGVKVISIYQAELLCVDKYLIEKGLMYVKPDLNYDDVKTIIFSNEDKEKNREVLNDGLKSYSIIKNMIQNL